MIRLTVRALSCATILGLSGCGEAPPTVESAVPEVTSGGQSEVVSASGSVEQVKIAELTAALMALGPNIDPAEAAQVARISVEYPLYTLAPRYGAVDPPLIHNIKVNTGSKPRGLCKDWADDMEARFRQMNLKSFSLHRAIANHDNFRIEHSTVILSARGDTMKNGIVIDPWREGQGVLFWSRVNEDEKYNWWRRQDVFDYKRARGLL